MLLNIHVGYFSVVTPSLGCLTLRFLTGGHCDPHLNFLSGALDQSWLWQHGDSVSHWPELAVTAWWQCVTLTRAGCDSMVTVCHWPELAVTAWWQCVTDQNWLWQHGDSVSHWPELAVTAWWQCVTDQNWLWQHGDSVSLTRTGCDSMVTVCHWPELAITAWWQYITDHSWL